MPKLKPIKKNIVFNTSDIAPPKGRTFFAEKKIGNRGQNNVTNISRQGEVGKSVLKGGQKQGSDRIMDAPNQQFVENVQSAHSMDSQRVKERPFLQEVQKITKKTEAGYDVSNIEAVPQTNVPEIKPKIIAFNHSQYLYDEAVEPRGIEEGAGRARAVEQINEHSLVFDDSVRSADIEKEKNNTDPRVATFFQKSQNRFKSNVKKKRRRNKRRVQEFLSQISLPDRSFVVGAGAVVLLVAGMGFLSLGFQAKNKIEVKGVQAVNYLKEAKIDLENKDFEMASNNLLAAKKEFADSQKELDKLGGSSLNLFKKIPILSKIASGKNMVDLGAYLTSAVYEISKTSKLLEGIDNSGQEINTDTSLADLLIRAQRYLNNAKKDLIEAENVSASIQEDDLPTEYRDKIKTIKELLPLINNALNDSDRFAQIFLELLGTKGPRKYLIVFQNNQEMRPTGGFIGSYGLLETNNGKIDNLKIEGIYNPDGQLEVDVVPPRPIQKISAGWSTHDSNWWPDFPTSANKIEWFYEKAGGPTVDGVIAVTPVLLQKMLEVTGPIEMPEYNKTITDKNFIKEIQQQVEVDYDKEENKPKKILADLTPKLFDKFFESKSPSQIGKMIKILLETLNEKHILIYFNNDDLQKTVSEQGWSGEILETDGDYLSVVNTNINGYKTDGVIKETIIHSAKIESDGSIVDTVIVTRKHQGGKTDYEWWNKVNADYMRIYVPEGSELISVDGQTREFNEPRLAYDKLGFQEDPDIAREEKYTKIDPDSGTRIYKESGKTVFANWVYVSPQEQVTVTYKYKLPFKLDVSSEKGDSYSLLMQKQAGSVNSYFISKVEYPFRWRTIWLNPEDMTINKQNNELIYKHNLDTDKFIGIVFKEKN